MLNHCLINFKLSNLKKSYNELITTCILKSILRKDSIKYQVAITAEPKNYIFIAKHQETQIPRNLQAAVCPHKDNQYKHTALDLFKLYINVCLYTNTYELHRMYTYIHGTYGVPSGTSGKELACQRRRCKRRGFSPWVGKISWWRAWQLTPVSLPGESHGQRSLVDYSPGCEELDN